MAIRERGSLWRRLSHGVELDSAAERELRQLEEKHQNLEAALEKWDSLLREMEYAGQSGQAQYQAYYKAYLTAKQQYKRSDLELFNLRRGLSR